MDDRHAGGPASHRAETPVRTRRWVLGGAGLTALAAAGGVVAGFAPAKDPPMRAPHPPPAVLVAAAAGEAALIADLDATTGGSFAVRQAIAAVRADHVAHLAALRGLLARYDAAPGAASSSTVRGTPRTRTQLGAAETLAASSSASRAAAVGGSLGALLASISACEATHAGLFA